MKKLLIVLVVLLLSASGLFASYFIGSASVGLPFFYAKETLDVGFLEESGPVTMTEKALSASINASGYVWIPAIPGFGINLGFSALIPITNETVTGETKGSTEYSCQLLPKVGVSYKYEINEKFRSVSSVGYEMLINMPKNSEEGTSTTWINHGIYADETISYSFTKNVALDFGVELLVPIAGNLKSKVGPLSLDFGVKYAGIMVNPHIGVGISL